jgi:cell division transport system permease protein
MRQNIFTILCVGFLLFILGFIGLSLMTGHSILDFWKQKLLVIVELKDDVEENDLEKLQVQLENAIYVTPNTIDIITKDEAATLMREDYGNDFLSEDMDNPLHHVYTFNVTKAYSDTLALEGIRQELKQNEAVFDVFYEADLSQKVSKNLSNFLWYALGLSILFIFVAFFVVRQSVLLQQHAAQAEILNEEEDWRLPTMSDYMTRSFKNALWSGTIAVGGLMLSNYWMNTQLSEMTEFLQHSNIVIFLCILFVISVLVYLVATFFTVKK